MLREIRPVRQSSQHTFRRWFTDADMDLFIWFSNQTPVGFQLSYGKRELEHVISWERESGFSHSRVDDGEDRPARYKMTPILLSSSGLNLSQIARSFLAASEAMDPSLADFIYARLLEHPRFRQGLSDQGGLSTSLKSG
jgi:hypothetical protein